MGTSDAGYGFIGTYADMVPRQKAGKALVRLSTGAKLATPQKVNDIESDKCLSISNEGRMLIFPLKDLPMLAKGKGNKIIHIPSARAASREEYAKQVCIIPENGEVILHAGKRKLTLSAKDLEHYSGERGRRGSKLPRGLQRVDHVEIELKSTKAADTVGDIDKAEGNSDSVE